MARKRGFDTPKYISLQSKEIILRAKRFDRIYLEFGGHLCYDGHAARVLPGYNPKAKTKILKKAKISEIIYCVSAKDLGSRKRLGDFKLDYRSQTLKDLASLKKGGMKRIHVAITMHSGQPAAKSFAKKLISKGYEVYFSPAIPNYLKGAKYAVDGYSRYPYLPVESKIVAITGAAGGSGKMATAMSQVYHDLKRGVKAGYAKFETFPIWNLPENNPINLAYEAATADLGDKVMIDPYHLKAYGKKATNYNRDIQNFSILMRIARLVTGQKHPFGYKSPTDMGISTAKSAITDIDLCNAAALEEIQRRWKVYNEEYALGKESKSTLVRMKEIIRKARA